MKDTSSSAVSKKRKASEADGDIYRKVIEFEEREALDRPADVDAAIYLDTCDEIRNLLGDIFKLKTENKKDGKTEITQKRTQACLKVALLKKLNRLEKVRMSHARDALNQEKQKLDSINLQFQNLLYELDHLVSEFKKCKQYKSKDEELDLISIDKFLAVASSEVIEKFKGRECDSNVKHELHLALLEHELEQRIAMAKLYENLENDKKLLAKTIVARKEKLDGLGPHLSAVIEATKPLQELLGLPVDKVRAEHKLASLLPDELYLFYCNGDAFRQVNADLGITLEIVGDQEEAVQFNDSEKSAKDTESENEESQEEPEPAENGKRRHRKASQVDKQEEKRKKILEAHPLSIELAVNVKGGPVLKIKVTYRTQLKLVTVTSIVTVPSNITGNSAREILQGESVLCELFEGDVGTVSPNPNNIYQLQRIGINSYEILLPKLGHAYIWAQKLCGLDFLNAETVKQQAGKISQSNMEITLRALQKRLKAKYMLAMQLQQLEQNCIGTIPESVEFPKTAVSTLTNWASVSFQKFCQDAHNARDLIEANIAGANDLFYAVTVARPKVSLHASVIIKNDYPLRAPIFVLSIKHNGDHNSSNSDEIRDMERSVNVGFEQTSSSASWLLSAQLRYLCSFLDVFLETAENSGFAQNTMFFRRISGRNRRRPFRFRKIGNGVFTQY